MYEMDRETVDSLGTTVDDIVAIGRLLESPRLAHIWFTLNIEGNIIQETPDINPFMWDGLTVTELSEHIPGEIPQSTLYSDLDDLEDFGAVQIASEGQPTGYRAQFFQAESENVENISEGSLVGAQILGLVGEAFVDKSVERFLEKYSYNLLNDALIIYTAAIRGRLDRDFPDMFPEVETGDLEAIIPAIERVLLDMSRDPLWGYDYRENLKVVDSN